MGGIRQALARAAALVSPLVVGALVLAVVPASTAGPAAAAAGPVAALTRGGGQGAGPASPAPRPPQLDGADQPGVATAPDASSLRRLRRAQSNRTPLSAQQPLDVQPADLGPFATSGYAPRADVPRPWWPYARTTRYDPTTVERDAAGVAMLSIGGVLYDHPVRQAQDGLSSLESDRIAPDPANLKRAIADATRLLDRRVESRSGWFYPYGFDFTVDAGTGEVMTAPWYSGMAQGQALSLFVRLYERTGDPQWRTAADATFASLLLPETDTTTPYATHVDPSGQLWLEEYPRHPSTESDEVYNGSMFALFGVWDYFRLTADPRAETIFRASAGTVRHYAYLFFRVPFWASHYCMRHGRGGWKYHQIHVEELLVMHAVTGSPDFAQVSDRYRDDYPRAAVNARVLLAAGTVTGYRFRSGGAISSSRSIRLSRLSSAPATLRARIQGRGYYYLVSAGTLAGYWVAEKPDKVTAAALMVPTTYAYRRTFSVAAGAVVTGYVVDEATAARSHPRTITFGAASAASFDRSAWVDGAPYLHVVNGSFAGRWLPQRQVSVR